MDLRAADAIRLLALLQIETRIQNIKIKLIRQQDQTKMKMSRSIMKAQVTTPKGMSFVWKGNCGSFKTQIGLPYSKL